MAVARYKYVTIVKEISLDDKVEYLIAFGKKTQTESVWVEPYNIAYLKPIKHIKLPDEMSKEEILKWLKNEGKFVLDEISKKERDGGGG